MRLLSEIDSSLYDPVMRIAALSDFHIGSSTRGDCFRHAQADFHAFLDELEADHDRIVLLGDIFQAEHGPLPGQASKARELVRAQARVAGLWRRFQGAGYDYLHGNHDACAGRLCGAGETLRIEEDGFGVFFVHGHQFDPLMGRMYPVAQASTWLSGRVRRFGLGAVADWLEHKDIAIKHEAFKGEEGPYALAARRLLTEHEVNAVVMGHTHVALRMQLGDGLFANTGTCSMRQRMFVSIDTMERSVELHRLLP